MTPTEYVDAILKSFPPGQLDTSVTSNIGLLIGAFADGCARLEARALSMLEEADPRTTVALLADWERNYNLPDACAGPDLTTAARQLHLTARVKFKGGQSGAFFVALAGSYSVTITVAKIAGSPFTLQINAPLVNPIFADCGISSCTDALETWGNTVLECAFNRVAHAHTTIVYDYT